MQIASVASGTGSRYEHMRSGRESRAVAFVTLCSVAAFLVSCGRHSERAPKLIEADGSSYVACSGAVWMLDDSNFKDLGTWSYRVIFNDAKGIHHELKRVRILKITSLPTNTPACSRLH